MSRNKSTILGITMGDPGGIGPEVTLKALQDPVLKKYCASYRKPISFVLIGSPDVYQENALMIRSKLKYAVVNDLALEHIDPSKITILDIGDNAEEVCAARVALPNAVHAYHALEVGAYAALHGVIDALVNAPLNKEAIQLLSPRFTGHTEYLARMAGVKNFAMMLQGGPLRVVLVTTHLPLSAVSSALTVEAIVSKIVLTHSFLTRYGRMKKPRIGVAGLNPHAGEGGKIGREEIECIMPALKAVRRRGIAVEGPLPADVIFHQAYKGQLDAVVAMYHDQGLGPLKMIAFETGVNVTLGLPFIRTSTDHGTAFNIAYQNKAHPGSMVSAIITALDLCR